jgi:hypothetical protein
MFCRIQRLSRIVQLIIFLAALLAVVRVLARLGNIGTHHPVAVRDIVNPLVVVVVLIQVKANVRAIQIAIGTVRQAIATIKVRHPVVIIIMFVMEMKLILLVRVIAAAVNQVVTAPLN